MHPEKAGFNRPEIFGEPDGLDGDFVLECACSDVNDRIRKFHVPGSIKVRAAAFDGNGLVHSKFC